VTAVATVAKREVTPIFPRVGAIRMYETHVMLWEEQVDDRAMHAVPLSVVGRMRFRGFKVMLDPRVAKDHPLISRNYYYARKGDLEAAVEVCGHSCEACAKAKAAT